MSHSATNWAIQQRGIKPAAKIVLWHLCDRYNPDHGCFPSQARLADDCEMSRSSLNMQLKALEEAGLIRREQRYGPDGGKIATRYWLAFEDGFEKEPHVQNLDNPMSGTLDNPCPKSGQPHVQNLDNNHVRENHVRITSKGLPLEEPPKKETVLAILTRVLSKETAQDFILHRRTMKKPLTPRAAKLIVNKLAQCSDPEAAIDTAIERGWQTVYPKDEPKNGVNRYLAMVGEA